MAEKTKPRPRLLRGRRRKAVPLYNLVQALDALRLDPESFHDFVNSAVEKDDLAVHMSPKLINAMSTHMVAKGIDKKNSFADKLVSEGCDCNYVPEPDPDDTPVFR